MNHAFGPEYHATTAGNHREVCKQPFTEAVWISELYLLPCDVMSAFHLIYGHHVMLVYELDGLDGDADSADQASGTLSSAPSLPGGSSLADPVWSWKKKQHITIKVIQNAKIHEW